VLCCAGQQHACMLAHTTIQPLSPPLSAIQLCPMAVPPLHSAYLALMSKDLLKRTDVVLVLQGTELPCHSAVLAQHSRVFDKLLSDTAPECSPGSCQVTRPTTIS